MVDIILVDIFRVDDSDRLLLLVGIDIGVVTGIDHHLVGGRGVVGLSFDSGQLSE